MAPRHPMVDAMRTKRWTRSMYERLGELGIFHPAERLELIEGEIIEVSPQGSEHATAIMLTLAALQERVGSVTLLRVQLPLALDEHSQVEPDIAAVSGTIRDYKAAHPSRALFVVEISDATLLKDREAKCRLYAKAGIPEYWIVNLIDRRVEIYKEPAELNNSLGEFGYRLRRVVPVGEKLVPPGADEALEVSELLP